MHTETQNREGDPAGESPPSPEILALAFEYAPDAHLLTDRQGRIRAANTQAERMFGYARAELVGRPVELLIPDRFAGPHVASRTAYLAAPHLRPMGAGGRLVARRKDGTELPVDILLGPVGTGPAALVLAVVRDVTDRRQLEEQLRQSQKMEAIGQLAGGIAHDFNNLLTIINGFADLLRDGLPHGDPRRESAAAILEAGERAARLTRQLLAFSRKQVLEPKVVDLNAAVGRAAAMLGRLLGENVVLVTALDPALWRVRVDPGQIDQVIVNLCVNARDAMPQGGRLILRTANATEPAGSGGGRAVELSVADTGAGMTEEVRDRAFEPFFTTKEVGRGTGLGLSTAYGIVTQSGGVITVESAVGKGTTFRVLLPAVESAAEPAAGAPPPPEAGGETILLVEDDPAVRGFSRLALEKQGYAVLVAAGGAEALAADAAHAGPLHLAVTDVAMPGMDGRQLAEVLRHRRPGLKVLFVSGYAADAVGLSGSLGGSNAFLAKPYTAAELARKARQVLDATG